MHFTFLPHEKLPYPIGPLEVSLFHREQIVERVSFEDFCGFPNHIDCREDVQVGEKLLAITREYEEQKRYCKTRIDGLLKAWIAYVAQLVEVGGKAQPEARTKQSLRGVIDFIHTHYNEPLTYEDAGAAVFFPSQLYQPHASCLVRLLVTSICPQFTHEKGVGYAGLHLGSAG